MMFWLTTVSGLVLVGIVLRDVFHTLFHPSGQGSITRWIMQLTWRLSRLVPTHRQLASLAGPIGMTAVIAVWGTIAVTGWTLVYLPNMADGLSYSPSLDPAARSDLLDALYLSLVTVATLGFGDIVPTAPWLRLATPLQALVGFVLLTAAVSWVLQIYPALHRRRVLALRLITLRRARLKEPELGVESIPTDVLTGLAANLVQARTDLSQYAATYFFRDSDRDVALAAELGYAATLASEATLSARSQTRLAGAMLTTALDSLADLLDHQFLHLNADTAIVLNAYAADHRHADTPGS